MGTLIRWSTLTGLLLLSGLAETRAQFKTAPKRNVAARPHTPTAYRGVMSRPHYGGNGYRNPGMNRNYNNYNHNNYNNSSVVPALQSALSTLSSAQHDYQGHRVKAMHEVQAAIRHMQPAAARSVGGGIAPSVNNGIIPGPNASALAGFGAGAAVPKTAMPQATSDAHLRKALQSLSVVESHLRAQTQSANRAHVQAHGSVQRAAQELRLALNIR